MSPDPGVDLNKPLSDPENAELAGMMRSARREPERGTLTWRTAMPTATQVHGNLWMGGWPSPSCYVGEHFDRLVLFAREYQVPECFGSVQVAQVRLNDDGTPMTRDEAVAAVRTAARVIRWLTEDLRVLVTCFAGRNRSGLVCALALCKGPHAMPLEAAVKAVRTARGDNALSNPWFNQFLKDYCGSACGSATMLRGIFGS